MSKFKYKNISDQRQEVANIGVAEAGEMIETDEEINNPNFEEVKERFVGVDPVTEKPKRGIK